jgi:hypothetical protein
VLDLANPAISKELEHLYQAAPVAFGSSCLQKNGGAEEAAES